MIRNNIQCAALIGPVALVCATTLGAVQFYTQTPATNQSNFDNACAARSLVVDSSVDFVSHPNGAIVPNWYQASNGLTIVVRAGGVRVETGSGSATGNTGPGLMPEPSRYLNLDTSEIELQFDPPIAGIGIMTADMYLWGGVTPNASITLLSSADVQIGQSLGYNANFQLDYLYFMGATDDDGRIAKVRYRNYGVSGDSQYITRLWIARPPCRADFNGDSFADFTDFDAFVTAFEAGAGTADFNADGFNDFTDFDAFVTAFEAGC